MASRTPRQGTGRESPKPAATKPLGPKAIAATPLPASGPGFDAGFLLPPSPPRPVPAPVRPLQPPRPPADASSNASHSASPSSSAYAAGGRAACDDCADPTVMPRPQLAPQPVAASGVRPFAVQRSTHPTTCCCVTSRKKHCPSTKSRLKKAPPWLISMLVHMLFVLVLGLWAVRAERNRTRSSRRVFDRLGEQLTNDSIACPTTSRWTQNKSSPPAICRGERPLRRTASNGSRPRRRQPAQIDITAPHHRPGARGSRWQA